jgi:broad specificity phosphatase PhoE
MGMPKNLLVVRHGQSEANVMHNATKIGDDALFTDNLMTVPDRSWRLTATGRREAQTTGKFIKKLFPYGFDCYMVSPYVRTRETAACLNLNNARWRENRMIRERFWGEIGPIPMSVFKSEYPRSAQLKEVDPLYWTPAGGESIAEVADSRVRGLLDTLHRENDGDDVIIVSHGDYIWSLMMVLERWSDEEFLQYKSDPAWKIQNGHLIHYCRANPETNEMADKLQWVRSAYPHRTDNNGDDATWQMIVNDWREFSGSLLTNDELCAACEAQPRRFA